MLLSAPPTTDHHTPDATAELHLTLRIGKHRREDLAPDVPPSTRQSWR